MSDGDPVPTRPPVRAPADSAAPAPLDDAPVWYGLAVAIVSLLVEYRYLHRGISLLDEGWAMYAAQQLHRGGTLYEDVLWVFPPAHVLTAWVGTALDDPGIAITRALYSLWTVALCVAAYHLGRRIMPSRFGLLGALMLAFAAPRTHTMQLLFGYRYLVLAFLVLLAFDARLRTGDRRWMLAAGALAGLALCFRLTPAFSVCVGVGVAVMLAHRDWRSWVGDWAGFAAGLAGVVLPVLAWFASSVGLETLWREIVVHPLVMLQPLPVPDLVWPRSWSRNHIAGAFWKLEFRLYLALYLTYVAALAWTWLRCLRSGRPFRHALLAALVIFGAVFYIRSHGRADEAHLDSTIPPICVLLAHASNAVYRRLRRRSALSLLRARHAAIGVCGLVLVAWILLLASDQMLIHITRGLAPIDGIEETIYMSPNEARMVGRFTEGIRTHSNPGDVILDLSPSPYFYVLTGRRGPGHRDVIMPGTFYDEADERAFIERLDASPPRLAIWPRKVFDDMPERRLEVVAPQVVDWVTKNYEPVLRGRRYILLGYNGVGMEKPPEAYEGARDPLIR